LRTSKSALFGWTITLASSNERNSSKSLKILLLIRSQYFSRAFFLASSQPAPLVSCSTEPVWAQRSGPAAPRAAQDQTRPGLAPRSPPPPLAQPRPSTERHFTAYLDYSWIMAGERITLS
jgi:hypothetical protein